VTTTAALFALALRHHQAGDLTGPNSSIQQRLQIRLARTY
jgi:hypothetical protein